MLLPRALAVAALAYQPSVYTGALYGVRVQVSLHEPPHERGHALIRLEGVPLGGRLDGNATFSGDDVVMDARLGRALALRRVALIAVARDAATGTLSVKVRLPFFGIQTVTLDHDSS